LSASKSDKTEGAMVQGCVTINVTDREGVAEDYEIPTGGALMFALRDELELPVEGACGGSASCGTCHVYLSTDWYARLGEPSDYEMAMLDTLVHYKDGVSRLSCQISVTATIDGLTLRLAPEE